MVIIFVFLLLFGVWTVKDVLTNFAKFMGYTGLISLFLVWLYYAFLESFLANRNRDKTAEVCVEEYGLTNQVSGKPRSGKDSSTIGEARLINELELEKDLEELEKLRKILYIYDFEKLHKYIDLHGEKFLVSGKARLYRKFILTMKDNNFFLKDYYIEKKIIDPKKHLDELLIKKDQFVYDYHMNDGVRPGGIPFQELLLKYLLLYTYRIFITNYIMSNQPILESFDVEDNGKINYNFSKKFSQQYIRIKEDNPIPLPLRGVIIETEMAILMSNVDQQGQAAAKLLNGIREFYTVIGHILGERIYMFAIVQDAHRQIKVVRELYQNYIHVFKQETVATASMRRKLLDFYKFNVKVSNWTYSKLFRLSRKKSRLRPFYQRKMEKTHKRVSAIITLQERLFNEGYLVTYKGVYSSIEDVGKKVRFPRFGVKIEAVNEKIISPAFGFKSYIKISDSWGRYNTHYIKFLRDSKETRHKMHFNDVDNWTSMEPGTDEAIGMDYEALTDIIKGVIESHTEDSKPENNKVKPKKRAVPDYSNLSQRELLLTSLDFGFKFTSWNELIGNEFYNKLGSDIPGKVFNKLYEDEVQLLADKLLDQYPDAELLTYEQWQADIISFLETEWTTHFAKTKQKNKE